MSDVFAVFGFLVSIYVGRLNFVLQVFFFNFSFSCVLHELHIKEIIISINCQPRSLIAYLLVSLNCHYCKFTLKQGRNQTSIQGEATIPSPFLPSPHVPPSPPLPLLPYLPPLSLPSPFPFPLLLLPSP